MQENNYDKNVLLSRQNLLRMAGWGKASVLVSKKFCTPTVQNKHPEDNAPGTSDVLIICTRAPRPWVFDSVRLMLHKLLTAYYVV